MRSGILLIIFLVLSLCGYGQCTLTANATATSTAICSGNSVVISANAAAGTAPYSYSWSTGETTAQITVNKANKYTVTVTDAGGCQANGSVTITSTATPNAPNANDVSVCPNTPATLTATAPGGVYQWYDANGNFKFQGATYTTDPISVRTVFYVEATVGGCTSPRRAVTVNVFGPPNTINASTCAGTSATLLAQPGYDKYHWYDSATGSNEVSSSQSFTTLPLTATTTYYVAGEINGCLTGRNPATAFITPAPAPPDAADASTCAGSKVNLHADAPAGNIDWFDVPTGGTSLITSPDFTTPALTATTTYYVQVTTGCVSTRKAVTVTVTQIPPAPAVGTVTPACPGTSAHLTATSTAGVVEWFTRASGGTAIPGAGNTFDTPILTRSTTFYVQANNSGCVGARVAVPVILAAPPAAPTASPVLICPGTQATLTATAPGGGTFNWYAMPTGGMPLITNDTYVTPALSADATYYVDVTLAGGCVSARTQVDVTVLPVTTPPTALGATICAGNTATLTGSGANNYQWYDAITNGNKLFDGQVYPTPALSATTTYYLQTTSANGCESARTAVTVTVNPIPAVPVGNTPAPVCTNSPAVLSVNPVAGITVSWYSAAGGGTALATGNNYTTPPLTNLTTYYAEASNGSCVSVRTPISATLITGINPQFQYPFSTVCAASGTVTPTINNPAGGTFTASPAGLVFVSNTMGAINTNASLPGTYVISFANNGACPGVTTAQFTIGTTTNAQFSYNGPFCQGGVNPLPVFPGASSAGIFTASPAGLVFINQATGEIDLANSLPNTYTITNTIAAGGACVITSATTSVTIFQKVTVDAGLAQTVQVGTPVQLAGSITGGTTTGTWSGGAGSFSNTSSATAIYTPGVGETIATLTLTSSDPAGPCGPSAASVTITFSPAPAAPTASGATICMGNSVTLSATAPGGSYNWYSTATGLTPIFSGPSYITPVLTVNTTYYVSTTLNGGTSPRTAVTVTVNPPPVAPTVVPPVPVCMGTTATLIINNPDPLYTYEWYNSAVDNNRLYSGSTITTRRLSANASYYVQAISNTCVSPRTKVDVTVNPIPTVTSTDADVCSGVALNYLITADIAGATFTWSRAADPNISNAAVSNQTSSTITETLINTGTTAVDVTYTITAAVNGCSGPAATVTVTVYPAPKATSPPTAEICNGTSSNYNITFDGPVSLSWGRDAVPGVSNAAVSGQTVNIIHEVLFNTTNAPVVVNYVFTYTVGNCTKTFILPVTVNPGVNITSPANGAACSAIAQPYTIQSNVPSATFRWSRPVQAGISNPAVINRTGSIINETLVNITPDPIAVDYTIVPTAFGCDGAQFNYRVIVNPIPVKPKINANSPVCVASTILFNTDPLANATYMWTGPDNFTSSDQNPQIPASKAKEGRYFLTVVVNGCSSPQSFADVLVNDPPTATAGNDETVCIGANNIQLAGQIGGGTTTGVWSSSGTGTFSPLANDLNAQYIFSAQDKASGSVFLTLKSTNRAGCDDAISNKKITFGLNPAADAGQDQPVCAQTSGVPIAGKILAGSTVLWSTSGTGNFSPSANVANAVYVPSVADVAARTVTLKFTVTDAGSCFTPDDDMIITFMPPPTLNAGGIRYVLLGHSITLKPTVSDENVTYLWSPARGLDDPTKKNPVFTADSARVYTLTVTDSRGCVSTDKTTIKVSPDLLINNTFTPNGDGINDVWNIVGLVAYEDAVVDIFNRDGTKLFHSIGYGVPWDGTSNGKPVPVGVYFYMIDTKVDGVKLSGSVTVIR